MRSEWGEVVFMLTFEKHFVFFFVAMERNFGWCVVDYLHIIQRGNTICGENELHLRAACFVSARWSGRRSTPERPGAKRPALLQAEGCTLLLVALLWSPEVPAGKLFFRRLIILLVLAADF
ncbi:hypothetical protein TcCL_ESM05237 [Trypanosoma cruzi]|nr:hypothetical protein TcCL_ESM05237 [Trypanosoma cruzi]